MKKNLLYALSVIGLIIMLIPSTASGQNKSNGIVFGLNISTWTGSADKFATELGNEMNALDGLDNFHFSNTSLIGVNTGIYSTGQIGKHFFIQAEYLFTIKGTKFSGSGNVTITEDWEPSTYEVSEDLSIINGYLELPILVGVTLAGKDKKVKPYFTAGPHFSYLVLSYMKVKVNVDGETETDSQKCEGFKKFDAGINLGFGLEFAKGTKLEIRYQNGLLPVNDPSYDDGLEMFNNLISINISIPTG